MTHAALIAGARRVVVKVGSSLLIEGKGGVHAACRGAGQVRP